MSMQMGRRGSQESLRPMFIRTAGGDPRDLLGNPHIGDLRSAPGEQAREHTMRHGGILLIGIPPLSSKLGAASTVTRLQIADQFRN
jgi:hypothetical protein